MSQANSPTIRKRDGLPLELERALTVARPSQHVIARQSNAVTRENDFRLAVPEDIQSIIRIVSSYPDNAESAQSKGFLRGRFNETEYLNWHRMDVLEFCAKEKTSSDLLVHFHGHINLSR